jgi:uncharacterized membrane protein YqjE
VLASSLSRLIPLLLRHLDAYGAVAGEDAKDAVALLTQRFVRVVIVAGFALLAAIMACAFIMMLAWDQPWREWVPAALALAFALAAIGIASPALRATNGQERLFPRVRREWRRDRELMERTVATLRGTDSQAGTPGRKAI